MILDIRTIKHIPGKSINLAMSLRGLCALDKIGLGEHFARDYGYPMSARMIHNLDGSTYPVPYGKDEQSIYSVGRRYVNEILLTGEFIMKSILFNKLNLGIDMICSAGEKFPNLHIILNIS